MFPTESGYRKVKREFVFLNVTGSQKVEVTDQLWPEVGKPLLSS